MQTIRVTEESEAAGSYNAIDEGVFSMMATLLSLTEPTIIDSETKVLYSPTIFHASSMLEAYWRILLVNIEIGVADIVGTSSFEALIVTVSPSVFIPERTPSIPGHVTET